MSTGLYAMVYYIRSMVGLLRNVLQGSVHGSARPWNGWCWRIRSSEERRNLPTLTNNNQSPGFHVHMLFNHLITPLHYLYPLSHLLRPPSASSHSRPLPPLHTSWSPRISSKIRDNKVREDGGKKIERKRTEPGWTPNTSLPRCMKTTGKMGLCMHDQDQVSSVGKSQK